MQMIVMVPTNAGQITEQTMHMNVQNGLKAFKMETEHADDSGMNIWLPQFKIGKMGDSKPFTP